MLGRPTLIICASVLSFVAACTENDPPPASSKEQPSKITTFETPPAPQWPSSHIAVQHFAPAAAAITCDSDLSTENRIHCGPSGMAAQVDSKFLGVSGSADVYEVTVITRLQEDSSLEPGPVTQSKTMKVLYEGTRLVIFEDEQKRVILYPESDGPATESPMKTIDRPTGEK